MKQCLRLLIVACLASVMVGCGVFGPKAPDVDRPYSGFMDDYQPLNSVEVDEREFIAAKGWIAPDADLKSYRSVIVDPIKIDRSVKQSLQITETTMENIREYMTVALTNKLEAYYGDSGPQNGRTLRAKVAITGLETRDEPIQIYEYWPSVLAITGMTKLIGIRDEEILLFVEAEFVDVETNKAVAKTMVGIVGKERLENEWEEVSLQKLSSSIDQWIEHQVTALQEASKNRVIVRNTK